MAKYELRHNKIELKKRGKEWIVVRSNPMNKVINKFHQKEIAKLFFKRKVRELKNQIHKIDMLNKAWVH